jgi:hypothetical protein
MPSTLRTLTVTPQAAAYVLGCLAERPYKEVAPLIDELGAQLRTQDATRTPSETTQPALADRSPVPDMAPQA